MAAGSYHTVLLCEDGEAVAFGCDEDGQCAVPNPPAGVRYAVELPAELWRRVTWALRHSGHTRLARAADAMTERGLRARVFHFLVAAGSAE